MADKRVTVVYETTDYDKFSFIEGNRGLDHIKRVQESIKNVGFLWQPILVNERFQIIEGQHRFVACKNLNIPVLYIVQPKIGMVEVQALNTCAKQWTTRNHIHARATGELEDVSYRYIEILADQFKGIPIDVILGAILETGVAEKNGRRIQNGTFKCDARGYEKALCILKDVEECLPYIPKNGTTGKRALCFVFNLCYKGIGDISAQHLKTRIRTYGKNLVSGKMKEAVEQIENIYNYRTAADKKRTIVFYYQSMVGKDKGVK